MKVLIYELWPSGHRYQYVREIIISILKLDKNIEIILVTSHSSLSSIEFDIHLDDIKGFFTIDSSINSEKITLWQSSGYLHKSIKNYEPNHVYIPSASGLIQLFGLRRFFGSTESYLKNTEIEAMVMSGGIYSSWKNMTIGLLWCWLTKNAKCTTLHVLFPFQKTVYDKQRIKVADTIQLSPEPVEKVTHIEKNKAKDELGLDREYNYIIAVGVIDFRKGTDYLLDAFSKVINDKARLVLAGKISEEIKDLIDSTYSEMLLKRRLILIDGYLTHKEFSSVFFAADVICLPYRKTEISSGIAVRAAHYRSMLLTSNTGWLGRTVRNFRIGFSCDVTDTMEFSTAIINLLSATQESTSKSTRSEFFRRYHSLSNFRAHWMNRMRERLKLPMDINYLNWKSFD